MYGCLRIKDMPPEERPRERLIMQGAKALSDSELLAIILGNGTHNENVIELSRRLFSESIKSLSRKRISTLKSNLGIGNAKACKIIACFELGRRLASFRDSRRPC